MRVLVACEESQEVCKAFRALGHEAYSCDIEPCSGGHPEWHIQDDALKWINGDDLPVSWKRFAPFRMFRTMDGEYHTAPKRWDIILAFPPCTYLSNAGAKHLFRGGVLNQERYQKELEAKKFFLQFLNADCPHICVENPVSSRIYEMPPYSQEVQPWMFGHPEKKATCLWLKGLPPLVPTNDVSDYMKTLPKNQQERLHYLPPSPDRAKLRSKTYPGIARAMAEQWGGLEALNDGSTSD